MTNITNEQLEAWAGLGPWEWAPNSDGEFECPRRVSDGQWIVTSRLNHSLSALSESHRDALTAAPDLARLVLEKDAEIARLKAAIQDIAENWEWWNEDRHDRCSSVVGDSIAEAEQAMKGDEKP